MSGPDVELEVHPLGNSGASGKPEEEELRLIEAEVASLQDRLAAAEEALASRRAELEVFVARYRSVIAAPKARVDRLEAELAEARATTDPLCTQDAATARARASASQQVSDQEGGTVPGDPPKEVRDVYRRVARLAHPDLAASERDRARRTRLMAEANDAYRQGDAARLARIEAEASCAEPAGESIGDRLVVAIRRRAAASARLAAAADEMAALDTSPLAELERRTKAAEAAGRDLLSEMASELERRATQLEAELTNHHLHGVG